NLFQKAVDLEPRFGQSHWFLAMAYQIIGEDELALQKIKDSEEVEGAYGWEDKLDNLIRVIRIYSARDDDANLIPLLERALELQPRSSQFWAMLAASYANTGEFDKAREAAKKTAEIDPSLAPQNEEFLKSLPK
ncbi:MAG TPA: tetratricopeptide repeat protein, partial [Candidatus Parcubacteria bacterium]|nr:tetratricopeptide repeat protein [Candidatus Parcubacteria bacterium]